MNKMQAIVDNYCNRELNNDVNQVIASFLGRADPKFNAVNMMNAICWEYRNLAVIYKDVLEMRDMLNDDELCYLYGTVGLKRFTKQITNYRKIFHILELTNYDNSNIMMVDIPILNSYYDNHVFEFDN